MMRATKTESIRVRLDRKLLGDVQKAAATDQRTISDWVRLLIQSKLNGKSK